MYGELPQIETNTPGQTVSGFPVQIIEPPKTCLLRLPKTDEMMAYLSSQKSLYKDLGRRLGESQDVPNPTADLKLFNAIRLDKDGDEFDEAEALYAISIVTRHRIDSCDRDGQTYVIRLNTIFGETVHTVKIPTQKDSREYKNTVVKVRDLPHNMEERRFPPEAPCKLYDKVIVSSTGYAQGTEVPPHHKRSAVIELVSTLSTLDPSLDPNS